MLKIIFDPDNGYTFPQNKVQQFVNNTIAAAARLEIEQVTIGNAELIDTFRLAIINGYIHHTAVVFIVGGKEYTVNEYASPCEGFWKAVDVPEPITEILLMACKMKKRSNGNVNSGQ